MNIPERHAAENARAYAIRVLLDNIISLALPPGSAVSENELGSVLHLSRTPVREALMELGRRNLVDIIPQRGSYISKIDYQIVEESRFMRLVMEKAVLQLACQGIEESWLNALEDNIERYSALLQHSHPAEEFLELDNRFHRLIFESVNKLWTYQKIQEQMVHFDRLRALSTIHGGGQHTLRDHEDLLYALRRKDAEMALMLMERHLTRHLFEKESLLREHPQYFLEG